MLRPTDVPWYFDQPALLPRRLPSNHRQSLAKNLKLYTGTSRRRAEINPPRRSILCAAQRMSESPLNGGTDEFFLVEFSIPARATAITDTLQNKTTSPTRMA